MDKWQKKHKAEQLNRIKPTTCQKYMKMVLASSLMDTTIGQGLVLELCSTSANIDWQYVIEDMPVRDCILWKRCVGQHTLLPATSAISLDERWQTEDIVVRILSDHDIHKAARNDELATLVQSLRDAFPRKRYTFLILGERKNIAVHARILTKLQLLENISVIQLRPNVNELLEELQRFTKAIAEIPHKQKEASLQYGFKKFLANDNKNCVRVEGCHGFGRLWQQHLNRLPLVTLEVAETLIAQYPCPKRLLDEYQHNSDAVDTIADLKIKRSGPIPLQTDRRIGHVMSEKLHTLYYTRDPNTLL